MRCQAHNAIVLYWYQYNPAHLMIAPCRSGGSLSAMPPEERAEMMDLSANAVDVMRGPMKPYGFNIGITLGEVADVGLRDHIHLHIVPHWNGDTHFMPVLGQTRVIPQALEEIRTSLHEAFKDA